MPVVRCHDGRASRGIIRGIIEFDAMPDEHKGQKGQKHCTDEQGPHQYSPVKLLGVHLAIPRCPITGEACGALLAGSRREHGLAIRAANRQ